MAAVAAQLTTLQQLRMGRFGRVDVTPLVCLPTLEHIAMPCESEGQMLQLRAQTQLRSLSLSGEPDILDLSLLAQHTRLHAVTLVVEHPSVSSVAAELKVGPLASLTCLHALSLVIAAQPLTISGVARLTWLTRLCMRGMLLSWSYTSMGHNDRDDWDAEGHLEHWRTLAAPLNALPALRSLDLSDNQLGLAEACRLVTPLSRLTALTHLSLAGCAMSAHETDNPAGIAAVLASAVAHLACLRELDLIDSRMYADGIAALAPVLESLPSLTKVIIATGLDHGGLQNTVAAFRRHLGHLSRLELVSVEIPRPKLNGVHTVCFVCCELSSLLHCIVARPAEVVRLHDVAASAL